MKDSSVIVSVDTKEAIIAQAAKKFPKIISTDKNYWLCLTEAPKAGEVGILYSRIDNHPTVFFISVTMAKTPKFKFVILKEMTRVEHSYVSHGDEFRVEVIDKNHKTLIIDTSELSEKYHLIHDIIQMPPVAQTVESVTNHKVNGKKTTISVTNEPHLTFYYWALNALKHAVLQFSHNGELYCIPGNKMDELFTEVDEKDKKVTKLSKIQISKLGDYVSTPF